jgi:antitoxin (DNA-binding transcriptional repressor) of toxin-antitoxin stability system
MTVTEGSRNFADLVNRAFYRGETTVLLKNGVPVARIAPVGGERLTAREFLERWNEIPRLGRREADAMARDIASGLAALRPPSSPWE